MSLPPPAAVYLDTNVLVNSVFPELPQSGACLRAGQALYDAGSVVYFSLIARMEFAQAFRSLATQRQIPPQVFREFDLGDWHQTRVRRRWMSYWQQQLQRLIASFPRVVELPLSASILDASSDHMARHALHSQDAAHLATALHFGIPVFWTCDDHFRRTDDLLVEVIRDPS